MPRAENIRTQTIFNVNNIVLCSTWTFPHLTQIKRKVRMVTQFFQTIYSTFTMKKTIPLVHPTNKEIEILRNQNFLDEKNRPVRMTHLTTCEMCDETGHTIAIYENVFLSPLEGSSGDKAVIFDREGKAFEISEGDIQIMGRPAEVHAV